MSFIHLGIFHFMVLIIIFSDLEAHADAESSKKLLLSTCGDDCQLTRVNSTRPKQASSSPRKLLVHGDCTKMDISISQSKDSTSGMPKYVVQIVNTCVSGCPPSDIHLHCGWFASARMINPGTFKRISYDDCLVNGGKPLKTSQTIRFTYSNSFLYPLAFKSAKFC